MKKFLKGSYGTTASITIKADGSANLIIRDYTGKKVKDSVHKNEKAARSAWNRYCN